MAPQLTGVAGCARGRWQREVQGCAWRQWCLWGHPCPLRGGNLLGSPGHAGDGLSLAWVRWPESSVPVWLCRTGTACWRIGKPAAPMVTWGNPPPAPLLEPRHRKPTWPAGRWHLLLPAQLGSCRVVAWPHHIVHGLTTPTLENVPGRTRLWPLLARLCVCPELLFGGTTRAEWLPARRRRVKATLCAMKIRHLLPGLTPDAGFNLP